MEMGIFDNLISGVKKAVSSIGTTIRESVSPATGEKIYNIANKTLAVITNPIKTLINPTQSFKETASKGAVQLVGEGVANTLGVIAPFTSAGKAVAANVVNTIIQNPIKSAAVAAVATPVVSAVVASPTLQYQVLDTPNKLVNAGTDLGKAVEEITNPQSENSNLSIATEYIKNHPYMSAASITAVLGGLGFSAAKITSLLATYKLSSAAQDLTTATKPAEITTLPTQTNATQPITIINQLPTAQEGITTPTVKKKTTTTKKKAKKKPKKKAVKKKAKKKSIKRGKK